ncbi:MAG: hypothetical protein RLZZ417_278 [Bacteroidota bacterium]|jgi:hypothetical protein
MILTMKFSYFLLPCLLTIFFTDALAQKNEPSFKKLFNGKNLKGWIASAEKDSWQVIDGVLDVKSSPERKGSILWTEKKFADFIFQTDFKMGDGVVDSGVFLKSEANQIQMGISGSLKIDKTGSPYMPGKGYPVTAANVPEILKPNDWNTMRIKCEGKNFTVWLNGKEVLQYFSDTIPVDGPIGLQLHPKNIMTIQFRNILIQPI